MLKKIQTLELFGEVFIGKIWGEGFRMWGFLLIIGGAVTGWYSRDIVLSLKLPSSTWVSALVPAEELKGSAVYITWGGTRTLPPRSHCCFLIVPTSFLHSLSSLNSNCLNLPFGTQGRSKSWNKTLFLQTRNGELGKDLYQGGFYRVLLHFMLVWVYSLCCVVQLLSCIQLCNCVRHTRLPCPLLSTGVCLNLYALCQWSHPTILSSVTAFSFYLWSFLASFPVSGLFTSGGQSIEASASATILPMSIQDWFPLGLTSMASL